MNAEKSLLTRLSETYDVYRAEKRRGQPQQSHVQSARVGRLLHWLMPNGGALLLALVLITTVSVWAKPLTGSATVPGPSATTVNYQGRLANPDGTPVADYTYGMSFALYDAATGGNPVWTEDHPAVPVSDGLFSVDLGSRTPGGIPTTTWNGDRYLEITVSGETLSPREMIRGVPIAGVALTVPDGAIGTSQIADGAVTQQKLGADISLEPPDGSITTAKLADGAVTASKAALPHGYIVGSSGTFALNTTYRTVPGLTLTVNPATPQVLHLNIMLDATSVSNQIIVGYVYVNGSIRGRPVVLSGNNVRASVSLPIQVNLSPGSHTIEVRAKVESGTGSYLYSENSMMTYIMFAQ